MGPPRFTAILLLVAALMAAGEAFAGTRAPTKPGNAPQPACKKGEFRVLLDVGHSAEVPGSRSARRVPEYEFNLRLARRIEKALVGAGFRKTLLLVTPGPARAGLFTRVARANTWPADLFISIHHDSVPDWLLDVWQWDGKPEGYSDRFSGHSIFVSTENVEAQASFAFAQLLGRELKAQGLRHTPHYTYAEMDWRRRELLDSEVGVYRYDQLVVLRDTKMPAVLFEAGSIVHRDEELLLRKEERQGPIAKALTKAVEQFCASRSSSKSSSHQVTR
jgi:N-acetylmuramoyl-L-alanine amidase